MNERDTLRYVSKWLSDLASLTAGAQPLRDAKTKIAAYAVLLADQFPAAAFSQGSLQHVAAANRFFPSYGEVRAPLAEWWREHKPAPRELAAPNADLPPMREPPTEEERAAVAATLAAYYAEMAARRLAPDTGSSVPPPREPRRAAPPLTPRTLAAIYAQAGAVNPRPRLDDEAPTGEDSDP